MDKSKLHLNDGLRNSAKNDIDGCKRKKGDKNFKTVDKTFNPKIHVMVKHPSGKGFIQKLKSEIK